ncbi:hypothetical protein AA23498_0993 [Acetobacter nitrogenifigens DSM 23921 = NBRC 105050]|nr:hypothetical protein [Acetobacter nitrogenifigens]GBQ90824.1 hypothetical protein AA23498_0993 [Acetobacter nitrogenifigens DSM 23921 = NBRC 105050]
MRWPRLMADDKTPASPFAGLDDSIEALRKTLAAMQANQARWQNSPAQAPDDDDDDDTSASFIAPDAARPALPFVQTYPGELEDRAADWAMDPHSDATFAEMKQAMDRVFLRNNPQLTPQDAAPDPLPVSQPRPVLSHPFLPAPDLLPPALSQPRKALPVSSLTQQGQTAIPPHLLALLKAHKATGAPIFGLPDVSPSSALARLLSKR